MIALAKTTMSVFRRVKKADVKPVEWVTVDPVDRCLDCWKSWMAGDADRDLGAKTMRGLAGDGDGYSTDPYEAQQASDNRIGAATDAMIDSMIQLHKWAIYRSCSIGTPWRFPNADLAVVIVDARAELESKLKRNVCTAVLF